MGTPSMNKLYGKIVFIESSGDMSIVDADVRGDTFSTIVLETPQSAPYLKIGEEVTLLFKETEVSIGKNLSGMMSLRNRISSRIKKLTSGGILTQVVLDYKGQEIVSIISSRSARGLNLKSGDDVEWLVKTNEISLLKE